jgi:outer membrane protein assembly factor BamE (lipoprotein component of BamABCDE complex)
MKRNLGIIILLAVLSGCATQVDHHGYSFEQNTIQQIKVGETDYASVLNQLGTPTSKAAFGPKSLYYISYISEKIAFLDPKIVEQRVLAITFDGNDVVSDISEYTMDDLKDIGFSESKTEIQGNTLTPIEQIMTNIGKFNKKKSQY